ncbi:hypothetical protein RFI_16538, partial [Reticulomyxa filosa]
GTSSNNRKKKIYLFLNTEKKEKKQMGSCTSSRDPQDQQIQEELADAKKQDEAILKVLLLGAGGSGKSTFFKQLTNTYGDGYSEAERTNYTIQIYRQIVESMQTLINQSEMIEKGQIASGEDEEELKSIGIDPKERHLYTMDKTFRDAADYILKYPDYATLDATI